MSYTRAVPAFSKLLSSLFRARAHSDDDLSLLDPNQHWLDWLGPDPRQALRQELESVLAQQVPGSRVEWVKLVSAPFYLTGAMPQADADRGPAKITRAGLAAPFALSVIGPEGDAERLHGVFSWCAVWRDDGRHDRTYLDLNEELAAVSERLKARVYEL